MLDLKYNLQKVAVGQILSYLRKDPEKNLDKVLQIVASFDSDGNYKELLEELEKNLKDKNNTLNKLMIKLCTTINGNIFSVFFNNLILNSCMKGGKIIKDSSPELRKIKPVIPLSPYSLSSKSAILSKNDMDKVIVQGKLRGIYTYFICGDEPLECFNDLQFIFSKHNDCIFILSTSGVHHINEDFCKKMCLLGNVVPLIKLKYEDGNTNLTSAYWQNLLNTLKLMGNYKILFGFQALVTSYNFKMITSENFIDAVVYSGAYFSIYYCTVPKNLKNASEIEISNDEKEILKETLIQWRKDKMILNINLEEDAKLLNIDLDYINSWIPIY